MIKANFNTYNNYVTDSLYQWDINQDLVINGLNLSVAPEIHFANANMDKAIVRQSTLSSGVVTVRIPNSLLQMPLTIKAYVGTYHSTTFTVIETIEIPIIARERPADYTIEDSDEEIYSFNRLENEIENAKLDIKNKCDTNKVEMRAIVDEAVKDVEAITGDFNNRVDNIVAHNNDTAGNTELIDIRTGLSGTVYSSAGGAIRGDLRKYIKQITNAVIYFDSNVNACTFETTASNGIFIKIPSSWYLRGAVTNSIDYSAILPDSRATSPKGVTDCIHVGHNKSLVFNTVSAKYTIIDTASIDVNDIPIFSVGKSGFDYYCESIGDGIGLYFYEMYCYAVREGVFFSCEYESKTYFEESSTGIYLKCPGYWWIRGGYNIDFTYVNICLDNRSISPNGVEDCIFIPHGKRLVLDRDTKTLKIVSVSGESVMPTDYISLFVTGHRGEGYGVVGGLGLYLYNRFVADRKITSLNHSVTPYLQWSVGTLEPGAGTESNGVYTRIRSEYILVGKGTTLIVTPGYQHLIYIYDLSKMYERDISWTINDITVEEDCYIRVLVASATTSEDMTPYVDSMSTLETINVITPYTVTREIADQISENKLPYVFETQYETAKETIRNNQLSAGKNGETFVWLSDLHWDYNFQNSPKIVRHIVNDMSIRNVILTGDYIAGGDHDENIELLRNCVESFDIKGAKTFKTVGNHDYNIIGATDPTHYFTENEREAVIMGNIDESAVFGDSCYYYVDIQKSRTRMIFLDTGDNYTFDDVQSAWLTDTLNNTPDGYRILVFQHILYEATAWEKPLLEKLYLSSQGRIITAKCDEHNAKGGTQVIAIFTGHIHYDHNATTTGGIPIITIDTDGRHSYGDIAVTRNTVNSQCMDVVTVDYDNRKISCVRIGRGSDRVINY